MDGEMCFGESRKGKKKEKYDGKEAKEKGENKRGSTPTIETFHLTLSLALSLSFTSTKRKR